MKILKSLLIGPLVGLLFCLPAYAQKTKAQLNTEIGITFPDQTSGQITPAGTRVFQTDLINSIMPTAPVVANNTVCFNGTTGLLKDCGVAPSTLIVGTTVISAGSSTNVLFDNAGIVGEYTVSGSGSVAMTTGSTISGATISGSTLTTATLTAPAISSPNLTGTPIGSAASTTVNGVACTLGNTCTITASAGTITPGVTTISSGTSNGLLYDNAAVLGNLATANNGVVVTNGSGVPSVGTTLPAAFALGTPTGTSLALGGATIGSDALGVTGTTTFNNNVKLNGISLSGTYTVGGTPSIAGSAINSGTVSGSFMSNVNLATSGNGGVTGTLPVANGGTGATAGLGARASTNLNIDEATSTGDANYTILPTDRLVYHTALSTARTDTLPAANSVNAGQIFTINDFAGVASASHTITLSRAGSDTINGVTTALAINAQYGAAIFWSDGTSKWTFYPVGAGGGVGTVTNVTLSAGNGTSLTGGCTITASGTCTINGAVPPPQGRITLAANTPVMGLTSCSGSACANIGTLRYDCYQGGGVPYFNGSIDLIDPIASCEVTDAMVSAASAGQVVASQVYDVWWVHGGTNRICLAMSAATGGGGGWASDTGGSNTARGTGFSALDNTTRSYITNKNALTNCFNGATNYGSVSANQATYLGTVFANGNGQVSYVFPSFGAPPTAGLFGVFNAYNRVMTSAQIGDTSASYTYASATIRECHNYTTYNVQFVTGLLEDPVTATNQQQATASSSGDSLISGPGVDSTTVYTSLAARGSAAIGSAGGSISSTFSGQLLGFHTISCNESATGATTITIIPTGTSGAFQAGMTVSLRN